MTEEFPEHPRQQPARQSTQTFAHRREDAGCSPAKSMASHRSPLGRYSKSPENPATRPLRPAGSPPRPPERRVPLRNQETDTRDQDKAMRAAPPKSENVDRGGPGGGQE